jgi:hypothetical protein
MRSWKSHRLTSHTWLGLNRQIGRPLSRIVEPLVYFCYFSSPDDCRLLKLYLVHLQGCCCEKKYDLNAGKCKSISFFRGSKPVMSLVIVISSVLMWLMNLEYYASSRSSFGEDWAHSTQLYKICIAISAFSGLLSICLLMRAGCWGWRFWVIDWLDCLSVILPYLISLSCLHLFVWYGKSEHSDNLNFTKSKYFYYCIWILLSMDFTDSWFYSIFENNKIYNYPQVVLAWNVK